MPVQDNIVALENNDLLRFARNLSKRKIDFDKSYFEQYIRPAWDTFEKFYNEYVVSIEDCIEFLESDEFQYEILLERMHRASAHIHGLRVDFVKLLAQIHSSEPHTKTNWFQSVMSFALSVEEYLGAQGIVSVSFAINSERNDKGQMKKFLDEMLAKIKGQYQKVLSEYQTMRLSFLVENNPAK